MFTTDTVAVVIDRYKGTDTVLVLTLTDGTTVEGTAISVNSKGVNLKATDGKTITRAISRITAIETEAQHADAMNRDEAAEIAEADAIDPEGDELGAYADPEFMDDDEIADAINADEDAEIDIPAEADDEGLTASEAADVFGIPAKDLRKVTRAMGLGVGRGRVYRLAADDMKAIDAELKARAAAIAEAEATAEA